MIDFLEKYLIENPTECWSNKSPINKEWSQVVSKKIIKKNQKNIKI